MSFLEELSSRRRSGMHLGLERIRDISAALGNPHLRLRALHVAGTNGKGMVCAVLEAALRANGFHVGRYTSPHLVRLNERFFLDGVPVDDATLEEYARRVLTVLPEEATFFEALTALAYLLYAEASVDWAVLECGLGGRLDATNICQPAISIITRVGLDHCDWLGNTRGKIAAEKAGIIKSGVPIVLGRNEDDVRRVIESRARELGAPFYYAPDLVSAADIPSAFPFEGVFNQENAITALAALKVLKIPAKGLERLIWPGRFQRIGNVLIDGAHNPPAAQALAASLDAARPLSLIAGFCSDKDSESVLKILAPFVRRGFAVRTNNPRSLSAEEAAEKMRAVGFEARPCESFSAALKAAREHADDILICGSLFLAGEALVELGAYPWGAPRFDGSELLRV